MAKITTGSAADTIKIDGVTSDSSGFEVSTKESDDYIQITSSGDGSTAKITIDGGRGSDTIALDTNVDLSLSNLSISSVENITLARGGSSQKIAASDISGESFKLFSTGSGTAKLSVVVDQATINLSKLTFDSSFKNGYESIEVDASSSSASVNITGSSDEALTGSNANDTLLGGDGADIISAGTGNDTLEGGLGADTMTGGAGDDEFDFSSNASTENLMDKITDYQAAAEASSNDTIDNITGSVRS